MNQQFIYIHNLNPIMFQFGFLKVYWYGFMFFLSYILTKSMTKRYLKENLLNYKQLNDELSYYCFLGAIIGGRIGYIVFYNLSYYLNHPLSILKIWKGGMSFHGGLIGVLISIYIISKSKKIRYFKLSDIVALVTPCALALGRIGNFINGEIWGSVSTRIPFSIVFLKSKIEDLYTIQKHKNLIVYYNKYGGLPRHAIQLYEFILEGLVLFFLLSFFNRRKQFSGKISALFLIFYSIFRTFIECFKEQDNNINLYKYSITLGQLLSFPMFLLGIMLFMYLYLRTTNKRVT